MSSREGILVSHMFSVPEIPSPNRVIPLVTVEIRVHYPKNATQAELEKVLAKAYADALSEVAGRFDAEPE